MRVSILIAIIAISAIAAHQTHTDDTPLITREYIEELKREAGFSVIDFEHHPFKHYSVNDFKYKLGLLPMNLPRREVFYGDSSDLPESFDSRVQWPDCVHPIRDQQQCGSCWAFAASESASDRLCIATKGKVNIVLSPQELVACDTNNYGCQGGYVDKSWDYIKTKGLVTDECFPYTAGSGSEGKCLTKKGLCADGKTKALRYKVKQHRNFATISDAKTKIALAGPIEAAFMVYQDFMSYKGGVYKHKSGSLLGGHAVKVIGWGVENKQEYWIVANSWNTGWGEEGHFRIAFGECQFEEQLWSGQIVPQSDNDFLN